MGREMKVTELQDDAVERITQRLSSLPDIHLPYSMRCRGDSVTQHERKSHLTDLLRRDVAVFLERYGSSLRSSELQEFEVLKETYEVGWHLKQLKSVMNPTMAEQRAQAVAIKNRRLAFMNRLMQDGQYFSDDAMRMRAPLLHHEYVGQFEDPSSRAFSRPGERLSEMLIRQAEEADFQARLKDEQEKAGLAEEEVEEEDSCDEDKEEQENENARPQEYAGAHEDASTKQVNTSEGAVAVTQEIDQEENVDFGEEAADSVPFVPSISDEELQSKIDDFTRIMQEKFLSGEDSEHVDYSVIDHDTALDDHWLKEISLDAEEKYFEED